MTSESWQKDQLSGSKGGGPLHKGSASRTGYLSEAGCNTVSDSGGGQGLSELPVARASLCLGQIVHLPD